jgi:hypothetical protein
MATFPASMHAATKSDDPRLDTFNKEVAQAFADVQYHEKECNQRNKSFWEKLFGK